MTFATDGEFLPVVDENDQFLGTASRRVVHEKGLPHRAVHILVFDDQGRLYLQKRSQAKDTHPGKWTASASGHVDPGESYLEAANRELAEELGLAARLTPLGKIPASPLTENEFTFVYAATCQKEPRPNPEEISRGEFFAWPQAVDLAQDKSRACPSLSPVLKLAASTLNSGL